MGERIYLPELLRLQREFKFRFGALLLELNDEELCKFEIAFRRIVSSYWIVPETTELKLSPFVYEPRLDKKLAPIEKQLFQLEQNVEAIFRDIKESLNNNLGRGYRTIASIHAANRTSYLFAAMIAKAHFDRPFGGIDHLSGSFSMRSFSMRPLQQEKWPCWHLQDTVCLSGFISHSPPLQNSVEYRIGPQNYNHEVVWIKDNEIYVASLPSARIIRPEEYCEFPLIIPLGIRYTIEWEMPRNSSV